MLSHLFHSIKSLVYLSVAFKSKRNGHNTNRKNVKLFGNTCYNRSSSCSCSSTHSSCDKSHFGSIAEHTAHILYALLCCLTGFLWFVSCPKSFLAKLQVNWNRRVIKSLVVCIAKHEGDIVDTLLIHMVDGVAASTTHTDDLDDTVFLIRLTEICHTNYLVIYHNLYLFTRLVPSLIYQNS